MATNHGGDPLGSILGSMGSLWIQKMGQNHKKLPCAKIHIFDFLAVIDFFQILEVTIMAPNHGGDPLGSILGPMGFHWVKKMGQNHKKLPCPKIRIFDHHAIIDFLQKMEVTVMAPSDGEGPVGSILGPMGSHWVKKNGSKPYKITMPQNSKFRLPRDHRFFPKNGSYSCGSKSRWGLPRVHHGANGSHSVQKIGQKRRKWPCPKIRIFDYSAVIDFLQKMEVTVMVPNHGGDPVGSILGSMGSDWAKKWFKSVENYHAPKFAFSTTPRSSIFCEKWKLRLWHQITVGTP